MLSIAWDAFDCLWKKNIASSPTCNCLSTKSNVESNQLIMLKNNVEFNELISGSVVF